MQRSQRSHFRELFGARVGPDLRIGDEIGALAGDHQRECREIAHAREKADDFAHVTQMAHIAAFHAADHRVSFSARHRERGNDGGVGADHCAGGVGRDAMPASDIDVGLHIGPVSGVVFRIDKIEVLAGLDR